MIKNDSSFIDEENENLKNLNNNLNNNLREEENYNNINNNDQKKKMNKMKTSIKMKMNKIWKIIKKNKYMEKEKKGIIKMNNMKMEKKCNMKEE